MHPFLNRVSRSIQKRFFKTDFDRTYDRWVAARGDATLRLDYPLTKSSLVLDLGGYRGDWAAEIFEKYGCRIFVFEPVSSFAEGIRRRFSGQNEIRTFDFALAGRNGTTEIGLDENSSSEFAAEASKKTVIQLKDIAEFFNTQNVTSVDLMKINIEGAEFDLLDYMLDRGLTDRIANLQIQFHNFVPAADSRRESIRSRLAKTHDVTYDFPFIWENWRKRS
ncbi:MAG: FkbM family methyltransferase [Bdellovibrionota bacterium]